MYDRDFYWSPQNPGECWPDYQQMARQGGGGPSLNDIGYDGVHDTDQRTIPPPVPGPCDNCFGVTNPWLEDYDGDGVGDACDNCPTVPNPPMPGQPQQPCGGTGEVPPVPSGDILVNWTSGTAIYLAELHIYGLASQGRIGMYRPNALRDSLPPGQAITDFVRVLRKKEYELKDHLGNVRVVISDLRLAPTPGSGVWSPDLKSLNNYYPFGMLQPGRYWQAVGYRYGFNGKEHDTEMKADPGSGESGTGASYDYGFRIYDARLARFLSVDPLTKEYPWYTPYQFAGNMPVAAIDRDGLEPVATISIGVRFAIPLHTTSGLGISGEAHLSIVVDKGEIGIMFGDGLGVSIGALADFGSISFGLWNVPDVRDLRGLATNAGISAGIIPIPVKIFSFQGSYNKPIWEIVSDAFDEDVFIAIEDLQVGGEVGLFASGMAIGFAVYADIISVSDFVAGPVEIGSIFTEGGLEKASEFLQNSLHLPSFITDKLVKWLRDQLNTGDNQSTEQGHNYDDLIYPPGSPPYMPTDTTPGTLPRESSENNSRSGQNSRTGSSTPVRMLPDQAVELP